MVDSSLLTWRGSDSKLPSYTGLVQPRETRAAILRRLAHGGRPDEGVQHLDVTGFLVNYFIDWANAPPGCCVR